MTRRLLSLSVWAIALFLLWLVLVGTLASLELYAGAVAAAIGAVAMELVRSRGLLRFRVEARWLGGIWRPVAQVVPDFALVVLVLFRTVARRELPSDAYVNVDLEGAGGGVHSAGWRAVAAAAGSLAPNTVVVDVDGGRRSTLIHKLVPERGPSRPL
jgi:multisubunit Na+/H+ antiporter MnhE subunit